MSGPVRVLYFIGDLGTGGSEVHLARMLVRLDRSRIEPSLLLLHMAGAGLEMVRAAGIPVESIDYAHGVAGFVSGCRHAWSRVRQRRPHVLHAYGFLCNVMAALFPLPRRGTVVLTSRRGNEARPGRRRLYRMSNPFVHRILCVSRATREFAVRTEGVRRERCVVIPNGIDLSAHPPAAPRSGPLRRVGTMGRLRQVKGSDLLLEAFARIGRDDLTLVMGGPADRRWGRELVETYRGTPGVEFPGEVEAASFLPGLDLFVLPSRSEGMSNALLEAMSVGLPIVATDVGGNREVLDEGRAGLLVAPSAAGLAEGIATLLDDPGRARELGRRARERVEGEHEIGTMVRRYEDLYASLVPSTERGA